MATSLVSNTKRRQSVRAGYSPMGSATYTYIYSFLLKKEHSKAAEALKKAVKDVVVLKDGMVPDGPSLDVVIKEWKELKEKVASKSSYVFIYSHGDA